MNSVLFVDASEELLQLAGALREAGLGVAHAPLERVIEHTTAERPGVLLVSMLGRADPPAIKNLLRAQELAHGVASIAIVRGDQLSTFDFGLGFDDFIVYPTLSDEIIARVRRAIWLKSGVESDNTLRAGDLHIDLSNYKVFLAGRQIDLTYKEYELLRFLASNRDKVFTREALLNRVWGYDFYGGARTVDVHVRRLRSKIEDRGQSFIETVRNVGYRFHLA